MSAVRRDPTDPARWAPESGPGHAPGTFAVVIGVSAYPHLQGGGGAPAAEPFGLGQLGVCALTAYRFFDWLRTTYRCEAGPLAEVRLLLAPTDAEVAFVRQAYGDEAAEEMAAAPAPTFDACRRAIRRWSTRMKAVPAAAAAESRALFFFTGHGLQVMQDSQVLLPSDYLDPAEGEVRNQAISTANLRRGLASLAISDQLFFLDACRNDNTALRKAVLEGTPILDEADAAGVLPELNAAVLRATAAGAQAWSPPAPGAEAVRQATLFGTALLEGLAPDPGVQLECADDGCRLLPTDLQRFVRERVRGLHRHFDSVAPQVVRLDGDFSDEPFVTYVDPPPAAPPVADDPGGIEIGGIDLGDLDLGDVLGTPGILTDGPTRGGDRPGKPSRRRGREPAVDLDALRLRAQGLGPDEALEVTLRAADAASLRERLAEGAHVVTTRPAGEGRVAVHVAPTPPRVDGSSHEWMLAAAHALRVRPLGAPRSKAAAPDVRRVQHDPLTERTYVTVEVAAGGPQWLELDQGEERFGGVLFEASEFGAREGAAWEVELVPGAQRVAGVEVRIPTDLPMAYPAELRTAAALWARYEADDARDAVRTTDLEALEQALCGKGWSAVAAVAAATVLLRARALDRLHDWVWNTGFRFYTDLPDPIALVAEQQALERRRKAGGGPTAEEVAELLDLDRRGLPYTSEAFAIAVRHVAALHASARAGDPETLATLAEAGRREALDRLHARLQAALPAFRPGGLIAVFAGRPEVVGPHLVGPG